MADTNLHPTHMRLRSSDSSRYDVVCTDCGAHDETPGGWGKLADPCPGTTTKEIDLGEREPA